MSYIEDFGLESPVRSAILLALYFKDRKDETASNILHLQKVIRYFQYLSQRSDIDFSNFKLGGVSYEVQENLETLEGLGLVEENQKIELTQEGKNAAKEIEEQMSPNEIKKLQFAKMQLNDLTGDETTFFMYSLIPDTTQNSTEIERLLKKRKELSLSLFLKGRINIETAIKWSGLSEEEFNSHLKRGS